ncbi:3-ketoacyl-ACP reductase [Aquisphaera insulae]|uniref:3-ketoacyl-ACP reductase n=1 Tax=Aquisphaera insulae TaxID=2712864 RepID=UPI0013EAEE2C|nr:3-ketoacyl-ACP reductase [Aquisphaera insulae]
MSTAAPRDDRSRVAVVTGGGRGIGRGIVEELAAARFSLVVNYRDDLESAAACCRQAESLGSPTAIPIRADVSDLVQGRRLIDETIGQLGRIDLWVNNAGVAPRVRRDLLEVTPESWDHVVGTNLRGPFFLTQSVSGALIRLQEQGLVREPQIVFITSISSTHASINRAEYCVAKAGLSMVAQLFAVALAPRGIRVYEVRPGIIDTDMTRAVHEQYSERIAAGLSPIRRWGTPRDVGRAVAAIASDSLPFSTGEVIHVDGGLHLRTL